MVDGCSDRVANGSALLLVFLNLISRFFFHLRTFTCERLILSLTDKRLRF